MWFSALLVLVSVSVLFWKYVLFVLYLFIILVVSHFGFQSSTVVLIASVPGHCLPFTFMVLQNETFHCTSTLLTPSFRNWLSAYQLVLKHSLTNGIMSSFFPKVLKSAEKTLKICSQIEI